MIHQICKDRWRSECWLVSVSLYRCRLVSRSPLKNMIAVVFADGGSGDEKNLIFGFIILWFFF